jgi:hypothetical protein
VAPFPRLDGSPTRIERGFNRILGRSGNPFMRPPTRSRRLLGLVWPRIGFMATDRAEKETSRTSMNGADLPDGE